MIPRTREEFAAALRELPGAHIPSMESASYNVFRAIPGDANHRMKFLSYFRHIGVSKDDAEEVYESLLYRQVDGWYYYVSRNRPLGFLGIGEIAMKVGAQYERVNMDYYLTGAWEAMVTDKPLLEDDMYRIELSPPTDEQLAVLI